MFSRADVVLGSDKPRQSSSLKSRPRVLSKKNTDNYDDSQRSQNISNLSVRGQEYGEFKLDKTGEINGKDQKMILKQMVGQQKKPMTGLPASINMQQAASEKIYIKFGSQNLEIQGAQMQSYQQPNQELKERD